MKSNSASYQLTLAFFVIAFSCQSQQQNKSIIHVGGRCDGCDLMYAGLPQNIKSSDTTVGWKEGTGQRMIISGIVYQHDGKTPAANVILYFYHTDNTGKYTPRADQPARQHGYLRGWVKTDSRGRYTIHSIKPMHYPNETFAAHIHVIVKEPKYNEYYLDEWVFDDDKYLTDEVKNRYEKRGGNGIMHAVKKDNVWMVEQNIICGLNIPDYPAR